ncbi:MAG: hypothetical protein Q8O67_30235 [Deltaproteobacteria bacterium]|nr:hypothetical protein [Deltaproteobacteria bacterium]
MHHDYDAASLLAALQQARKSASKSGLALALGTHRDVDDDDDVLPSRTPLDPILREALLVAGGVVELVGWPGTGALSLALSCMGEALAERRASSSSSSSSVSGRGASGWLCAIDPAGSLFSPAVQALGVPLDRLLVVVPPRKALPRVSVRAMKTGVFCAMVVDATDLDDLDGLPVRRFTLAAEAASATVFLLTHPGARRRQPLPTAVRAQLHPSINNTRDVDVDIERHRHGRRGRIPWQRPVSPIDRVFAD